MNVYVLLKRLIKGLLTHSSLPQVKQASINLRLKVTESSKSEPLKLNVNRFENLLLYFGQSVISEMLQISSDFQISGIYGTERSPEGRFSYRGGDVRLR